MRSKLWEEFKAFAFKGNMIDLAVAVVIGAAFSGVINSLVKDIIMPSISYVTTTAKSAVQTATDVAEKTASAVGVTTRPSTQGSGTGASPAGPRPAAAPPPPPAPAAAGDEKPIDFTWTLGRIKMGDFLAQLLNFLLIAFAVFVTIVKVMGSMMKRVSGPDVPVSPTTKECPLCLSTIPLKAKKCAYCTSDVS